MAHDDHIENWFQQNITRYQQQSQEQQRKSNLISTLRMVVFLLFITLSVVCFYQNWWPLLTFSLIAFGFLFGYLVNTHNSVRAKKKHYDLLVGINQDELKRLSLDLKGFGSGLEYSIPDHPYCVDLDLFGAHSLFQWLNRTVTNGGAKLLAHGLLQTPPPETTLQQQQAVKELSEKADWSQHFLANGLAFKKNAAQVDSFLDWVSTPTTLPKWLKPALFVLPAVAIGLTAAYFIGALPGYWAFVALAINGFLLYKVQPLAEQTYQQTSQSISTLRSYEAMIANIENTEFSSQLLVALRTSFVDKSERASVTIGQLKKLLSRIEVRQNFFYWIFNTYFLLDLIWLIQSEQWKARHSKHTAHWFESINRYELLISLGSTAYSQHQFSYPELALKSYCFKASGLAHPLIPVQERVGNDFAIENQGTVVVLTGSNMSGKSTFLRTLGVNIILARLGLPVCASKLELGDFALFTSMRTTDSLEQHVSSFYAELERINKLIRLLEHHTPTLFLLDELLKGTNSRDRNLGSTALIKQLSQSAAFGIVSTHDLSLGAISETQSMVKNFSFNSTFQNGKISFDYKLRPGLCQSFNATELMIQMGIDLKYDQPNS